MGGMTRDTFHKSHACSCWKAAGKQALELHRVRHKAQPSVGQLHGGYNMYRLPRDALRGPGKHGAAPTAASAAEGADPSAVSA
jgi:hypothetical protein